MSTCNQQSAIIKRSTIVDPSIVNRQSSTGNQTPPLPPRRLGMEALPAAGAGAWPRGTARSPPLEGAG